MELCSIKNWLVIVSTLVTVFLIYQEFFTFVVTKPTTSSIEVKPLETTDLPEIVVCLQPSFNSTVLKEYGYSTTDFYSRGLQNYSEFIGWNGGKVNRKASWEILEDALFVKENTKLITSAAWFSTKNPNLQHVKIELKTLAYPYGRCFSISPPNSSSVKTNTLELHINETAIINRKHDLKVFLMDKTNSLHIYPDENEYKGSLPKINLQEDPSKKSTFKTKISRSRHVLGDPRLACKDYTSNNSYDKCIKNDLLSSFQELLGCYPPLLAKDKATMCNDKFNLSSTKLTEVRHLFLGINQHDLETKCHIPCTRNKYSTKLLHRVPDPNTRLVIVFDRTLYVTCSTFSINAQTLLLTAATWTHSWEKGRK